MVGIEKEREIRVAMKADTGKMEGARNSRPSTMVEIFIMVISLDFLGLSSGAREFFFFFFLVCIIYVWREWRSHVGTGPWSPKILENN